MVIELQQTELGKSVLDLLNKLLVFKPADRITLEELREHPFVKPAEVAIGSFSENT